MGKRGNGEGSVRQRQDGTWEARLTNDGKRISKYFKTRKEAAAWLAEAVNHQNNGCFVPPEKKTVGEWLNKWFSTYSVPGIEDTTAENYAMNIRVHIIPGLGAIPLQKLTMTDVQEFFNAKAADGGRMDGKEGGLSPRTLQLVHTILHKSLDQAVKEGLIYRNPAQGTTLPKNIKKKPVFWNTDEVDRFLDVAEKDRWFSVFYLELGTGLRRGELLGLKWEDIDFEEKTVTINRQLLQMVHGYTIHEHAKSEAGDRTVALPDDVIETLLFHKRRQDNEKVFCGNGYRDDGFIFAWPDGRPIHPKTFGKHFRELVKKAGIRYVSFHAAGRHTHATELLAAGATLSQIQDRLGHSRYQTTADFYAAVAKELQRDAADKAQAVLMRRKKKAETRVQDVSQKTKTS
jgi:integrase